MNQEQFERAARQRWHDFSAALDAIEARKPKSLENFAGEYRALCRDLALAKTRRFDASLVDKLNDLALRGQQLLYQPRYSIVAAVLQFFARGFPQAVRRERAPILFATLLFYGSALLMMSLIFYDPDLVFGVMSPSQVADIEGMYDPSSPHHLRPRGVDTDAAMFGFYIRNNMSIGFRTFAGGIFAGVGSLLLLLFNTRLCHWCMAVPACCLALRVSRLSGPPIGTYQRRRNIWWVHSFGSVRWCIF
jgi:hypothetical protein